MYHVLTVEICLHKVVGGANLGMGVVVGGAYLGHRYGSGRRKVMTSQRKVRMKITIHWTQLLVRSRTGFQIVNCMKNIHCNMLYIMQKGACCLPSFIISLPHDHPHTLCSQ